jgi:hypothetical protein
MNKLEALVAVLPTWKEDLLAKIDVVGRESRLKTETLTMRAQHLDDQHKYHVQVSHGWPGWSGAMQGCRVAWLHAVLHDFTQAGTCTCEPPIVQVTRERLDALSQIAKTQADARQQVTDTWVDWSCIDRLLILSNSLHNNMVELLPHIRYSQRWVEVRQVTCMLTTSLHCPPACPQASDRMDGLERQMRVNDQASSTRLRELEHNSKRVCVGCGQEGRGRLSHPAASGRD